MPDHPRRRAKRHINLLKEFQLPVLGCLAVDEILGDDLPDCFPEEEGGGELPDLRTTSVSDSVSRKILGHFQGNIRMYERAGNTYKDR